MVAAKRLTQSKTEIRSEGARVGDLDLQEPDYRGYGGHYRMLGDVSLAR